MIYQTAMWHNLIINPFLEGLGILILNYIYVLLRCLFWDIIPGISILIWLVNSIGVMLAQEYLWRIRSRSEENKIMALV